MIKRWSILLRKALSLLSRSNGILVGGSADIDVR
jgi:hypothetical protein